MLAVSLACEGGDALALVISNTRKGNQSLTQPKAAGASFGGSALNS